LLPNLDKILHYARLQGVNNLAIITNGRSLVDVNLLNRFISSGLNQIGISLYSVEESVHDFLTKVNGSCRETLIGVKNAVFVAKRKRNFAVRVNILINSYNIGTLFKTVISLYKIGVKDFLFLNIAGQNNKDYFVNYKNILRFYLELSGQKRWEDAFFSFRGYPLCIFSDFIKKNKIKQQAVILQSSNSSRFKAESQNFLTHNLGQNNKLDEYEKICQNLFIRLKSCFHCSYKYFCPGVLKEYLSKFRNLY
jgi:MoaA/NifB/PqqE/SkfB family radical SAM enzyme